MKDVDSIHVAVEYRVLMTVSALYDVFMRLRVEKKATLIAQLIENFKLSHCKGICLVAKILNRLNFEMF